MLEVYNSDSQAKWDQSKGSGKRPMTIRDCLGPKAKKIVVLEYPEPLTPRLVQDIIYEVVNEAPENGLHSKGDGSESQPPLIVCSVEFEGGIKRSLQVGTGYACFEDLAGNQWWGHFS